jgi:hypothetical protein
MNFRMGEKLTEFFSVSVTWRVSLLAEFWGRNARSKAGQERPRLEEKAHTVSQ